MSEFLRDVRLAFRQLLRTPGFTVVALLTLALGIGASAAMFSAVDALLIRALPYPRGDRLVMVWNDATRREMPQTEWTNAANFHDWRAQSKTIADMAAYTGSRTTLSGRGEAQQFAALQMTWSGFDVLGVRPRLGRGFVAEDDVKNGPRNVIVSDAFWRRELGARDDAIGTALTLDGSTYNVVGVLPPRFEFPTQPGTDVYFTLQQEAGGARGGFYLRVIGRLADGVSMASAQQEMSLIADRLAQAYPGEDKDLGVYVQTLHEAMTGAVRTQLLVLFGATLLVLLIACANLANLLLARTASRSRELAVRTALGAARKRLVRQLLTESLVLGVLGGALGLALCYAIVGWLAQALPDGAATATPLAVDARVLGFAALAAVACAAIFGAAPALAAGGLELTAELRESDRGSAGGRRSAALRAALVVGNFALALTLTIGAGLFLKSLERLASVELGFEPERLMTFTLSLDPNTYGKDKARTAAFHGQLIEKFAALPGVESAALTTTLPLGGDNTDTGFRLPEQADPDAKPLRAWYSIVSPGYFSTMGIELRAGRPIDARDREGAPLAIVVNQAFARANFPGVDPVGKRLATGPRDKPNLWEIVGVAGDVRFFGPDQAQTPAVYLPLAQRPAGNFYVALRTRGEPAAILATARAAIAELDPALAAGNIATMEQRRDDAMRNARLVATLVGAFSLLALTLAAVGVYGVAAFTVAQRTREFGVRMALGASRGNLVGMVLKHGVVLAGAGVLLGLTLSAAVGRVLASLLFEVRPFDAAVFAGVCVLLLGVALVATLAPALRASRVDPTAALRHE